MTMAASPPTNATAWLRDNGIELSRPMQARFTDAFNDLVERYTEQSERPMRDASIMAAARYLAGELTLEEAGSALEKVRAKAEVAMAVTRIVTLLSLDDDSVSEYGAQRAARVDRMTIRKWQGKR
ncbi:hypothetical protein [Mycobacteroides abscessus]|uniref:hypothetical protein n=1 Tax=Mycobacteroides abscessus TaxID=36809 RepID=UPI00092C2CD9|nr:hypothetical protein [Mycobacteroides abscessus]DAZ90377.1 TPA_asm: helix-turn-helix DNA binding domain [Mycobacterium phage prophiFSQJ01-1]SII41954.1 Uncharacterised protein [Mycobacteroides abscessus subsp. abscessus]SIK13089.1 Uncharacterised protein [Mycobacteroides abscessus subsp. abscessus]SIN26025.1 Uncharacterised protein [Mycobacteroides abscessus subsp. abscessus]SLI50940.1 Uncharacterised protein [Mycobacteroides abscessus subsp. abscessus]